MPPLYSPDTTNPIRTRPCDACDGEGSVIVEGPDYLGRDGNCWRDAWEEACFECGGTGEAEPDDTCPLAISQWVGFGEREPNQWQLWRDWAVERNDTVRSNRRED